MEETPLLLMRTVIQAVMAHSSIRPFVLQLLQQLIEKQIWSDKQLWTGFLKCCELLLFGGGLFGFASFFARGGVVSRKLFDRCRVRRILVLSEGQGQGTQAGNEADKGFPHDQPIKAVAGECPVPIPAGAEAFVQ